MVSRPPLPVDVLERHVHAKPGPRRRRMRSQRSFTTPREIVAPRGARHAERLEEPRAGELGERLAAHARDDDRGQVVAGIAVGIARAGWEVQRPLPADDVEHVRVRVHTRRRAATPRSRRRFPSRAARSCESACAGSSAARRNRQLGNVLSRRIVERQLAVPRQEQNCRRRELLRDRAGLEDGVRAIATSCSRSAIPYAFSATIAPLRLTPTVQPGVVRLALRRPRRCERRRCTLPRDIAGRGCAAQSVQQCPR